MLATKRILVIGALAAVFAAPARAQSRATAIEKGIEARIDAGHSYASFWMGGNTEVSAPVNVAVAQAAGTATFDAQKPAASTLEFNLVPGGGDADLLAPDGTIREGVIARLLRYTYLSFRSTKTQVRRDGLVEFTGELTATQVTREQIPSAWNSAQTTSSYTDPVTARTTRTVTFVLTSPHAEFLGTQKERGLPFLATATMAAGVFPELSAALLDSNWPIVAQDEQCEFPVDSAGRRDYQGTVCTGKGVATTNVPSAPPSFGRDYSGRPRVQAPVDGPVTILLYLRLASPGN